MVTILAGRSSVGTEAACIAFTNRKFVKEISERLKVDGCSLTNHRHPFRVLVSMERYHEPRFPESNVNSLKICECRGLQKITE